VALHAEGNRLQFPRRFGGEAGGDFHVELGAREVDGPEAHLRGERHRDVARLQKIRTDEDLAEPATVLGLARERGVALLFGDVILRDEDLAERHPDRFGIARLALAGKACRHRRAELVQRLATRPSEPQPTSLSARDERVALVAPPWPTDRTG